MNLSGRRLILLAAVVSVIGHEAALAVGNGPLAQVSASLRATDHGLGWLLTVLAVASATVAGVVIAAWRITGLRRRLLAISASVPRTAAPHRGNVLRAWQVIFAVAVLAFLAQENLEHTVVHAHTPFLEPLLAGQYVATVPIFAALALLAATLGLRFGRRIADLAAALVAATRRAARAPRRVPRPAARLDDLRDTACRAFGPVARRAPPVAVPC